MDSKIEWMTEIITPKVMVLGMLLSIFSSLCISHAPPTAQIICDSALNPTTGGNVIKKPMLVPAPTIRAVSGEIKTAMKRGRN